VVIPLSVLLAAGGITLAVVAVASAAPMPTVNQVQQQLSQLNTKAQQLDEQYDQAQSQLNSANAQLSAINNEVARYQTRFQAMRKKVAQIAAVSYENGSLDAPTTLLTSDNPQKILNQASMLEELSSSNSDQMAAFLTAARQLAGAQASAKRVQQGKLDLVNQLKGEQAQNNKLISQQQQLLAQLTPVQAAAEGPGGVTGAGPSDGNNGQSCQKLGDPGAGSGAAAAAVQFVYDQLCCPYVFGGTGPCNDGFDCSGLMQAAWASAGVQIDRTSYEQLDEFPQVSRSDLQPGDIIGFAGGSHVGMYVGGGYLIDAPQTGEVVEKVPLSGWFSSEYYYAVTP
jgi:peptidoglycan DL-endopeptidase CwlO